MKKSILLITVLALLVFACQKKKDVVATSPVSVTPVAEATSNIESTTDKDTLLYYHRGACFGMCPIFDLVVYKNGRALYIGRNFVDRIGIYQTNISSTDLHKITETANSIGYFSFQDEYDNPHVTDLPTTITMIASADGKLKKVANRYKGPAAMKNLYLELDAMIEAQSWKLSDTRE